MAAHAQILFAYKLRLVCDYGSQISRARHLHFAQIRLAELVPLWFPSFARMHANSGTAITIRRGAAAARVISAIDARRKYVVLVFRATRLESERPVRVDRRVRSQPGGSYAAGDVHGTVVNGKRRLCP